MTIADEAMLAVGMAAQMLREHDLNAAADEADSSDQPDKARLLRFAAEFIEDVERLEE